MRIVSEFGLDQTTDLEILGKEATEKGRVEYRVKKGV